MMQLIKQKKLIRFFFVLSMGFLIQNGEEEQLVIIKLFGFFYINR